RSHSRRGRAAGWPAFRRNNAAKRRRHRQAAFVAGAGTAAIQSCGRSGAYDRRAEIRALSAPDAVEGRKRMTALREKRRMAFFRGHSAERLAALALMLKGFRIVARRYRTRLGEIDLIARRGNLV